MNRLQRIVCSVVPRSWAASIETESRAWIARCEGCGTERSVWELGGIRWKAAGEPRTRFRCSQCGKKEWHHLSFSG